MSKQKLGGTWTAAHLRRRGWTNELMRQLLPAPILFMNGGHPVRLWNRDIVREAENDPRFEQQGLEPRAHQAAAPGVRHARALLSQAWAPGTHYVDQVGLELTEILLLLLTPGCWN